MAAWGFALWLLFIGQFVVPFFALLIVAPSAQARVRLLYLAGAAIALRYLEAAVLLLPPLDVGNLGLAPRPPGRNPGDRRELAAGVRLRHAHRGTPWPKSNGGGPLASGSRCRRQAPAL